MKESLFILFLFTITSAKAQTVNRTDEEGPDSLNATFVHNNFRSNQELIIVNGMQSIQLLNVNIPTEVVLMDLSGKIVYKARIEQNLLIEKDNLANGFYILRTRSVLNEIVKKLYL